MSNTNTGEYMSINVSEVLQVIPRSLISIVVLFLVTRVMGKKQASELSLFDYIIGISIGNFAAEQVLSFEEQFINGVVAVLIFGGVAYLVSYLTMKNITLRRLLIGSPRILMQDGKINTKGLEKEKLDINDFLQQCRELGYFDINEIEYAIMEVNGQLSILPKGKYKPATTKDLNIPVEKEELTANILIDGHLLPDNIALINKDIKWVKKELKKKGYEYYHDIILATYKNNQITIYKKESIKEVKSVLE